jgi:hypothetical protein
MERLLLQLQVVQAAWTLEESACCRNERGTAGKLESVLLRLLVLKAASGVDTPRKRKRLVSCGRAVKQVRRGSVVAISQLQKRVGLINSGSGCKLNSKQAHYKLHTANPAQTEGKLQARGKNGAKTEHEEINIVKRT